MKIFKSNYKTYIIGVICVILLVISVITIDVVSYSNNNEDIVNQTYYMIKDNYKIQINYPLVNNRKLNRDIKYLINTEKDNFLAKINDSNSCENELNINYSYTVNNYLYSIHIRSYSYVGKDNKYHRNDKMIYYDSKLNKEINYNDLITDNKIYEVFRNECFDYIKDNKDILGIDNTNDILNKIVASKDIYNLINYDDNKLEVVFKPQSITEYDSEFVVPIDYSRVIKYLNSNYFMILDNSKDLDTDVIIKKYDRIRDSKEFENKKLIALTFDDGPFYKNTEKLIEELDKRDARVTFFMLGELAYKQPELVKKVYDYGHTIGSHTYDHKNLKKLDKEELDFEVLRTNEILSTIINDDIRFIRPPYGSYNEDILNNVDMAFILWNVDTLDWKSRDSIKVRDYIVSHVKDGDVVLLHDIHSTSVDGAIMAIDILREEGYEFVSLDELLVYRNINIHTNKAYRFFK